MMLSSAKPVDPVRPVRIAGAGPAGLAAAITLARAGRDVVVHERRADCGARFRGDLQGLENWSDHRDVVEEIEGLGIDVGFDCSPFRTLVESNGRTSTELNFERPIFYLVRRGTDAGSLDQSLKAQALDLGVDIRFRSQATTGNADILATGPVLSRPFGIDKGIVFETDHPDLAVGFLNDRAALRGYSYLLVTNGYGCLCTVLFADFPSVHRCFDEARSHLLHAYPMRVDNPRTVGGAAHFALEQRFERNGALVAGEAAGLQDFLWGFGIRTALRSGSLAARCLLEGRNYERAAAETFSRPQRAGIVNRFLFEALRARDYALVLALLRRDGRRRLRWMYGYNPLQRLLFPVARAYARRRFPDLSL
jgi:flavin-dependent dehydrogenase